MKESITAASGLVPVNSARPPAGYLGGKRNLSRRLVAMIESIEHTLYAEPFVGMGGVFFRRTRRPKAEAINDISGDVVTLFRILQRHYQSFMEELKWRFASRAEFERLMAVDPETCTDLERAARFLYLQRNAFGGKVVGRSYGVSYGAPSKFRYSDLEAQLREVHDRLEPVNIERLHYADFIARYDRPGALFFIDPPYHGNEDDYGHGVFEEADFDRLRAVLEPLQGRFIMSLNDTPLVRQTFAHFDIEGVTLNYRVGGKPTPAREVIITGGG
jgi:DNA adenine methylase